MTQAEKFGRAIVVLCNMAMIFTGAFFLSRALDSNIGIASLCFGIAFMRPNL